MHIMRFIEWWRVIRIVMVGCGCQTSIILLNLGELSPSSKLIKDKTMLGFIFENIPTESSIRLVKSS